MRRSIRPKRATATPVFETGSGQRDNRRKSALGKDHRPEPIHKRPPFDPDLIHNTCQTDPDLATVIDAWARLPEAVRAGIVAMVKAAEGGR